VSRRRIYLLRHAQVAYVDEHRRPFRPDDVSLTPEGREQAGRRRKRWRTSSSTA